MARDPQVTVKILGDDKGLQGALKNSTGGLSNWAKGAIGIIGGVFAVDQIIDWSGQILSSGQQIETWRTKTDTVFEGSASTIREWADQTAGAMGLTDENLAGLAANFGDLLKPMGFTADEAANMSQKTLELSGALSAWTGGTRSAAEVSEILAKAMLGEREQLKELGIAINQAEVDQRALAVAQADGRDEITQMDKALATQQLILEKSTDAQKAWADGSMDSVKAQNEWKSTVAELKEEFVTGLFPILQDVIGFLVDDVAPAVRAIIKVWGDDGFSGVMAKVGDSIRKAWPGIRQGLANMGRNLLSWIGDTAPKVAAQLVEWGRSFVDWVRPQIRPAIDALAGLVGDLLVWLAEDGVPLAVEKLAEFGKAFVEWVAPLIPPMLVELGSMLVALGDWILTELVPAAVEGMAEMAGAFLGWIANDVLPELPNKLGEMLNALGAWVTETAIPAAGEFMLDMGEAMMEKLVEGVTGGLGALGEASADVGNAIWEGIKAGINQVIDAWNRLDPSISVSIPGWVPGVGGKGWESGDIIPDIPPLHTGGRFQAKKAGGVGLALLRDGERVVDAFRGAAPSGGPTIIVQGSIIAERDLIRLVNRQRGMATAGMGRL